MASTGPAARARRAVLRDELVADVDGLMTRVEADLSRRMATPDPLGRRQTLQGVQLMQWLILRWLDQWVDGAATTAGDLDRARLEGTRSVEDGTTLGLMLRAWRLAPRSIIETLQRTAGDRLEPRDLLDLTQLILEASDQLAEIFEISHRAELGRRASDTTGARSQLIHDILAGNQASPSTIEERSAAVGLALPAAPVVFAIVVDQASMVPPGRADLDDLVDELRRQDAGFAAAEDVWATLYSPAASTAPSPTAAPDAATPAGVGALVAPQTEVIRLTGLITEREWYAATARISSWARGTHAFKVARASLAGAPHWALADRRVLTDADVQVLTLLREPGRGRLAAAAVADAVLGPLLEPDNADVLAALEAFLAEGSAPLAARRLDVHPQTLRRRLARARELTDRNLHSSWDRFVLDVATTVAPAPR